MPPRSFTLEGTGLRSGRPARIVVTARPGSFAFDVDGERFPRTALEALDVDGATVLRVGETTVATVEHLFAAAAGLGLHDGFELQVEGHELPLLDGAARAFATALESLGLPPSSPPLVVRRPGVLVAGASRYTFTPDERTRLDVTLSYDDPRVSPDAGWDGSTNDFVERIASARTFAFAADVADLVARGHAAHVDPQSVVVLTPDVVLSAGGPFIADEPARHKLLDLMGDLFVYGGPPRGRVHAYRPGHRATHSIMRQAFALGIVSA